MSEPKNPDPTPGIDLASIGMPPSLPLTYGWLCPTCGRGNAPTNATCPCKPWPTYPVTCGGIVGRQGGGTIS